MLGFVSEPQLTSFHNLALGPPTHYYGIKATVPGDTLPPTGVLKGVHLVHILERFSLEPEWNKWRKKKKKFLRNGTFPEIG